MGNTPPAPLSSPPAPSAEPSIIWVDPPTSSAQPLHTPSPRTCNPKDYAASTIFYQDNPLGSLEWDECQGCCANWESAENNGGACVCCILVNLPTFTMTILTDGETRACNSMTRITIVAATNTGLCAARSVVERRQSPVE